MLKHFSSNTMFRSRNPLTLGKKPNGNVCKTIFSFTWFWRGSYHFARLILVLAEIIFETMEETTKRLQCNCLWVDGFALLLAHFY